MKKLLFFLAALISLQFVGCSDPAPTDEPTPSEIVLSKESILINKGGTKNPVYVDVTYGDKWDFVVSGDGKSWCTVSRNTNSNRLKITAGQNGNDKARTTSISVFSKTEDLRKTITVKQLGQKDGLVIGKGTYEIAAKGGPLEVEFACNTDYEVEIESGATWITYDKSSLSDNGLTLNIAANKNKEERKSFITIKTETGESGKINIKQRGKESIANAEEVGEDVKVTVNKISSTASDSYGGTKPQNLIDGDLDSYYSAAGDISEMPVSLTCEFTDAKRIDYVDIVPGRVYGKWGEVDVFVATADQGEYLYGSYDFKESGDKQRVTFGEGLINPRKVRFSIKTANIWGPDDNGHCPTMIAAHEIIFYMKNPDALDMLEYFTDESYSELKEGVTEEQIDAIENEFFRNLASDIFTGDYDTKYRAATYKPYPHPDVDAKRFRTSTYSLNDNVTGMYFEAGEHVVFVNETYGVPVSLRVIDYQPDENKAPDSSGWCNEDGHYYPLIKGQNKLNIERRGLVYVMYHTEDPNAKPIKINFPTAFINKYYDLENEPDADWTTMLKEAKADHIDMVGKHTIFTLPVEWIQYYCGTAAKAKLVINQADSITFLQEQIQGHHKYNTGGHRNRMLYSSTMAKAFMFAGAYRTGYSLRYGTEGKNPLYQDGTVNMLLNPKKFRVDGWGAYHEVGHVNQLPGFKWTGLAEVTNNFTAMYCAHHFIGDNFPKHKSDYMLLMSGDWYDDKGNHFHTSNRYDAAWQCFNDNGKKHAFSGYVGGDPPGDAGPGIDPFFRIVPFWQLFLYNTLVMGREDFYPDVYHQCRVGNLPDGSPNVVAPEVKVTFDSNTMTGPGVNGEKYNMSNDGERQMNFIRLCCDAAQEDLTEFFEQWGLMTPFYGIVEDYGNHVLRITPEMVQEVYDYAKKYPKPAKKNIWFINNYNLDKYRNGDGSDVTGFDIPADIDDCDGKYLYLYNGM